MTNAYALRAPIARPRASASRAAVAARRGIGLNLAVFGLLALMVGAYLAAYVATVLAVGAVERAEGRAAEVAAELHDAERAAARVGALSFGDAAAAGLSEVAPRFVSADAAAPALSMNGR